MCKFLGGGGGDQIGTFNHPGNQHFEKVLELNLELGVSQAKRRKEGIPGKYE